MIIFARKNRGFTLVEMLTVMAIIGISMGIFYTVFFMNCQAFDEFIARADFGQDVDAVVDQVARDGRGATQVEVAGDFRQVVFTDPDGKKVTYRMKDTGNNTGALSVDIGKGENIITHKLDLENSDFRQVGKGLQVNLTLREQFIGRLVTLSSSTEFYSRN